MAFKLWVVQRGQTGASYTKSNISWENKLSCGDLQKISAALKNAAGKVDRSEVQNLPEYQTIQQLNQEQGWPVGQFCKEVGVSRAAYYKWLKRTASKKQSNDENLASLIPEIYQTQHGIPAYRQMTVIPAQRYGVRCNPPKSVYCLIGTLGLHSICRRKNVDPERKPLLSILLKIF